MILPEGIHPVAAPSIDRSPLLVATALAEISDLSVWQVHPGDVARSALMPPVTPEGAAPSDGHRYVGRPVLPPLPPPRPLR
jgi:hypothetical protein